MITTILLFLKGVPKQIWFAIAAGLIIIGAVTYCSNQVEKRVEEAEEKGQVIEQNKVLEKTIENVTKAEEAREEINSSGPTGDLTRYNQCLRSARTPANCERFLPSVQKN